jgi:hypothetical protein
MMHSLADITETVTASTIYPDVFWSPRMHSFAMMSLVIFVHVFLESGRDQMSRIRARMRFAPMMKTLRRWPNQ